MVLDSQSVLLLPKASRAYTVGETGMGKSTLDEVLCLTYQDTYGSSKFPVRTFVADTKPRYRAEKELNGFSTLVTRRYAKWGLGSDAFRNSYALNIDGTNAGSQLKRVWALGGTTAIASVERRSDMWFVIEALEHFFDDHGAKIPRLVFIDEAADFYRKGMNTDILERIARVGRERNCALIAGSQRPRKVPTEFMTEMKRLYMFYLSFVEDIKHIQEFGIPKPLPEIGKFQFYLFDKELRFQFPSNALHELVLPGNVTGGWQKHLESKV